MKLTITERTMVLRLASLVLKIEATHWWEFRKRRQLWHTLRGVALSYGMSLLPEFQESAERAMNARAEGRTRPVEEVLKEMKDRA